MYYRLPATLSDDIARFATLAEGYVQKRVSTTEFKAFRVPMGVYEQRKNEVYMARIRATGGVMAPSQLLRVIEIAQTYHSNLLHLTTRQEIQIQNLALAEVPAVLSELQKEGLTTKGGGGNTVRNIMVSEESGLTHEEVFDTTPYALELTSRLIAEPDSYLLPRKMKIAFSSDDHNVDYAAINDVGLVAQIRDGVRGFRVYVGGGAGAKPTTAWLLFDFLPAEQLQDLIEALKQFFSAHGNRKNRHKARIRFIFYKWGEEETLRVIRTFFEEARKNPHPLEVSTEETARPAYTYQAPEGLVDDADAYAGWKCRYVQAQRQPGLATVLVPVLLGNIRIDGEQAEHLSRLLRFVRQFGEDTLRFTNTQNIRLRHIPEEALPELYSILTAFPEDVFQPVVVNQIISCTGADTCRLGIGLSKGLALAIRKELLRSDLDLDRLSRVTIHVTGCPNSCGQQLWADLGFAGRVLRNDRAYPGYQIFLAANRRTDPRLAEPVGNLSARDIPVFVRRLLGAWLEEESLYPDFTAYLKGKGREVALQLIEEYKTIPSFEEDKNYYFDWGADQIFAVTERGKAECSAGLFDMIQVDLDTIAYDQKQLAEESDPAQRSRLVKDIVFSASRMLLVTRGLDPKSTREVYDLFLEHFIQVGYVESSFRGLVEAARDEAPVDFAARQEEAYALVARVKALYESMDDSLQFKKTAQPVAEPVQEAPRTERRFKDLRGVLCPMNFVRTKLELAQLPSGGLLEIWLDDGHPIENVPGSVRNEGHTIVSQEPVENYWKVIIRKK